MILQDKTIIKLSVTINGVETTMVKEMNFKLSKKAMSETLDRLTDNLKTVIPE